MKPNKFIVFTIIYILLILVSAFFAYKLEAKKRKDIDIKEFLNNFTKISPKVILVGIIFGIIFGMMDNLSLYFGIEGISKHLKERFNLTDFQVAGYSNAYSGVLGITFATFVTLIAAHLFPDVNQDKLPVWLNTIGFLIGSIIGIYIPTFLFGRT